MFYFSRVLVGNSKLSGLTKQTRSFSPFTHVKVLSERPGILWCVLVGDKNVGTSFVSRAFWSGYPLFDL